MHDVNPSTSELIVLKINKKGNNEKVVLLVASTRLFVQCTNIFFKDGCAQRKWASKASHVIGGFYTAPVITGMMWMERPWAYSGCFNTTNKFQCLCGCLFICGNTHEGYFQKSNCSQVCERSMYVWYLQLWLVSVRKKRHKEESRIQFNCCLHSQGFRSAIMNQIICQTVKVTEETKQKFLWIKLL